MLRNTFFAKPKLNDEIETIDLHTDDFESSSDQPTSLELPVDLVETPGQLILRAPISGGGIDDIDITLNPDQITLTKRPYNHPPDKEIHWHHQECYWGQLTRVIDLPQTVDPETTRASLADGILTIIMPLYKSSKTKIIRINP